MEFLLVDNSNLYSSVNGAILYMGTVYLLGNNDVIA